MASYERKTESDERTRFVVETSRALAKVYLAMFFLGVFLFVFFFVAKSIVNESATNGHLVVFSIFAGIGLIATVFAKRWKITVDGDSLRIFRLFRRTETVRIDELDSTTVDETGLVVLRWGGSRLNVECLSDGYDRLLRVLRKRGKLTQRLG